MADLIKQMLMENAATVPSPFSPSPPQRAAPSPYVCLSAGVNAVDNGSVFCTVMTEESVKANGTRQLQFHIPPPSPLFALPLQVDNTTVAGSATDVRNATDRAGMVPRVRLEDVPLYYPSRSDPCAGMVPPITACLPRTDGGELETVIETSEELFFSEFVGPIHTNAREDPVAYRVRAITPPAESDSHVVGRTPENLSPRGVVTVSMQPALLRLGALQALLILADPPRNARPSARFTLLKSGIGAIEFEVLPIGCKTPRRFVVRATERVKDRAAVGATPSNDLDKIDNKEMVCARPDVLTPSPHAPSQEEISKKDSASLPVRKRNRSPSPIKAAASVVSSNEKSGSVISRDSTLTSSEVVAHLDGFLRLEALPEYPERRLADAEKDTVLNATSTVPLEDESTTDDNNVICFSCCYAPLDDLLGMDLCSPESLNALLTRSTSPSTHVDKRFTMQWSSEVREKRSPTHLSSSSTTALNPASSVGASPPPITTTTHQARDEDEEMPHTEEERDEKRWSRLLSPAHLASTARSLSLSVFSYAAHFTWCQAVCRRLERGEDKKITSPSEPGTVPLKVNQSILLVLGNPLRSIHTTISKWASVIIIRFPYSVGAGDNKAAMTSHCESKYPLPLHSSLLIRVQGCIENVEWVLSQEVNPRSHDLSNSSSNIEVEKGALVPERPDTSLHHGTIDELLSFLHDLSNSHLGLINPGGVVPK